MFCEREAQKITESDLVWYSKRFHFCLSPTELARFSSSFGEFEKETLWVIGASCGYSRVHFAWLSTAKG